MHLLLKVRTIINNYDVESIAQNGDIMTDLNGTTGVFDRKLSDVTGKVKFTFTAPTKSEIQMVMVS